jgi:hypothetical protein
MVLPHLLDHPFSFHLNKRIQLLKDKGLTLAGFDTRRGFFVRTEITFGNPSLLLIVLQGIIGTGQDTRSASYTNFGMMNHSGSLFQNDQTPADTCLYAGRRDALLAFPNPGSSLRKRYPHPPLRRFAVRDLLRI